jgi:hypothetical protein
MSEFLLLFADFACFAAVLLFCEMICLLSDCFAFAADFACFADVSDC